MSAQATPAAPLYAAFNSATASLDGALRSFLQLVVADLVAQRNALDALIADYIAHTHKSSGATGQTSIPGSDAAGTTTTTPTTITAPTTIKAKV